MSSFLLNPTQRIYSQNQYIHQLFEAQVERSPDAVAVVYEATELTYKELNTKANQLAHYLQSLGVKPEVLVGICVERSLDMVIGLLGILKAGGAYVPLDPVYPSERLDYMMADAHLSILLTQKHLVSSLPPHQAQIICLDTDSQLFADYSLANPVSNLQSNNLAYVIYTSGSTGKPKGVLIQHQSVVNYIQVAIEEYQLCPEDRILQFASYSFDTAVEEIFSTLSCGATLVLRTDEMLNTIATFLQRCQDWQITVLDLPTAYWHQLISTLAREKLTFLPPIRLVIIGGERAIPAQVKLWQEYVGSYPRLVNGYGPTEATVVITLYDLSVPYPIYGDIATQSQGEREVPIGRPIQNCQVYILDKNLQPVPDGIAGELHIGGIVLARGYLNRPELTAEKFISLDKLRATLNSADDSLGERLYKTGDLVRYLSDGNIEYLGRIDNQVKLRGFRIELEEIEAVLASHSLVQEAVVIVREDIPGEQQLVAYFVCPSNQNYDQDSSPPVSASDLRSYLKEKLPDYMVPATFVTLTAIPLTPNGKIDRRALPKPSILDLESDNYLAPRNDLEEAIAGIWAEVLQLKKVGVNDKFFDLGGHSLSAIRVITRMQELGVFLSLRDLFTTPTIAGLVQERETNYNQNQQLGQPQLSIQPVNWENNLPLSFAQESLWFLDQLNPQSGFYNIPTALHLQGTLNYQALRQSIQEIIRRHAALRTNFTILDGEAIQVIAPSRELDLKELDLSVVDLQALPTSEQAILLRNAKAIATKKLINTEAAKPFNLAQESLIRVLLLQLKATEQILVVTMHHIVSDGWSMGIFVAELTALYGAFVKGQPSPLPELTIQYPDFAVGQRQWLQGEVLESQIAYWQQQLADAPSLLELPYDRPRPARQTYQGATQSFPLSIELSNAIALLSRKQNATVFMTLVAAFQTLLFRYTQSLDICIGSPIANRNQTEIESLIGFFVNTLVLRTNLAGEPSFEELLSRVKEVALAAYAHQDVPLEKLVEVLQPQRSLSYSPLFQVMFVLQNTGETTWELEGLSIEQLPVETSTAKFDLILSVDETKTGLVGNWEYNTDLFDHATITRMAGHFQILLEGIIAHPQEKITHLPLISTSEQQLFQTWNQTQTDYPKEATIHELFETQVEKTPEAVALVFAGQQSGSALRLRSLLYERLRQRQAQGIAVTALRQDSATTLEQDSATALQQDLETTLEQDSATTSKPEIEPQITQLTYQELNQRANQLAHYLTTLGVKPEVTVGIFLDRSIDLIVATLAILKAGGVYVPLDPAYPPERLAFMFANAQVEILLTESSLAIQFPTPQAKVICLDESYSLISQYSTENLINLDPARQLPSLWQAQGIAETALRQDAETATNLAYIMYTSGSTGQPKGVSVTHRGVVRLVKENNYADLDSSQVFLQLAPTAFDASTLEIWGSLLNGAKLVIPPAHKLSLTEMGQLIQHYQVNILWLTAGLFHLMVDECLANLKPIKQLLAGGDILSVPHVQRFLQTHPHCQLINGYGPTENTTFTCCYRIPEAISGEKSIPIGLPIANTQVYILDPHLQPVPIGVKGELYLVGDGLARGYFKRPDLTAEKFITNPFKGDNYKLYKTGDAARYLPDGNIEFLGRLDNQVKIRGFRIELGEVESILAQHPQVQQTIVLAQEDMPGEKYLVAYVTLSEDSKQVAVNTGDQYLAAHLSLSEKNNKEENRECPANPGSQIGGDYLLFEDFRQFLQQKLPDYMMPTTFIILESFPLNAVGKIDRLRVGSQYHRALSDSKQIHQGQEKILVAPRDQVEEQLLQIWLQVLGKQEIGIHDRFFEDLGGTSLKAARLFLRIEETFGKVLPLAILYEAPTIALLAKIIRQQEWSPSWSSLVTIQPQGTKIPLFCIHPGGGNVLCYRTLAPYLGADQPVYGLQSRGLDGQEEAIDNIQVMASNYIQEIKTIQPQGPYLLAGYSLGGTIAYEVAQQLQQSGQEVAAVILLDAISPQILRQGATPLVEKLKLHNANLQKLNFPEQWDYFRHRGDLKLKAVKAKLKDLAYYLQGRANPDAIADHLLKLDATNFQALLEYQPQPYTGKVVIFETIERPTDTYYSPSLGWAAFIKYGLEIIDDIPGHHGTMLEEPYVAILGKKLHAYIEQFN